MSKSISDGCDLDNFIDTIRKKLQVLKEEEYQIHNQPIEIPPETSLLLKNNNQSSPRDYQILMQKQRQIQLRRKGFVDVTSPEHLMQVDEPNPAVSRFGSGVNLLEDLDLTCYQRPWGKLEHELKINRTMHFVQKEIKKNALNDDESKRLRILLVNAINHRIITKKSEVEYDESSGELKQIFRLEYDPAKRHYYLRDCDDPQEQFVPPEKGENGYIARVSELSTEQLKGFKIITKDK